MPSEAQQKIAADGGKTELAKRERLVASVAFVVSALCLVSIQAELFGGFLVYLPQALLAIAVAALIGIGAEWLVDSACRIAEYVGVSHLVIGLTIVAFGTSAPEMAASLGAGIQGNGDITIANVVGSNIFNLCFILGGVALLVKTGLHADQALIRRDGPLLLAGTVVLFLFVGGSLEGTPGHLRASDDFWPHLLNFKLERVEGIILLTALLVYLYGLYRKRRPGKSAKNEGKEKAGEGDSFGEPSPWDIPLFALGLGLVLVGCYVLVGRVEDSEQGIEGFGALWFARMWGVPDYVVGVTIVAAGTSAPEFIVSLVAALRGAYGLSAGNLIGSDIFNMLGVVGLAGTVLQYPVAKPVMLSPAVVPSLVALSTVVAFTIFFMYTGKKISRWEGLLLVLMGAARWTMDFTFLGRI